MSGSLHNIQLSEGKMLCFVRQSCPVSSLKAATAFVLGLVFFPSHNVRIFFQILVCAISVCCFFVLCSDKCFY